MPLADRRYPVLSSTLAGSDDLAVGGLQVEAKLTGVVFAVRQVDLHPAARSRLPVS
jgi:hypothetical protein